MKRWLLFAAFVVTGLVGAGTAQAATAGSIQLLAPAENGAVGGVYEVRWSYAGLDPATQWVVVDAKAGPGSHKLIAVEPIDEEGATPDGVGSAVWDTREWAQRGGYQVRIRVIGSKVRNQVSGVTLDNTAPSIALQSRTPANDAGWNNTEVSATWSCADSLSGPVAASVTDTVSTEGSDLSLSGTCADRAGNTASDSIGGINLDKTAPQIALEARSPEANEAGWNVEDVTVSWTCSDALSGAEAASVADTVTGEGDALSASGTCADAAGNTTTQTVDGIKIDRTGPEITLAGRTPANDAGWNNTDVIVAWDCSDALSGAYAATFSRTLSEEGAGLSASGACTDLAGNEASDTQGGINIDKTHPTTAFAGQTSPNAHGWNNSDVLVSWSCGDALSGPAAESVSTTVTGEGAGLSGSGSCSDIAGNVSEPNTIAGINIDRTAPEIAFDGRTPEANDAGWANTDVTLAWSCSDTLSGPAESNVRITLGDEGENLSATGTCADLAGNSAADTREGINIDKTAPGIEPAGRTPANEAGWNNTDVAVEWACSDALSGAAAPSASAVIRGEGSDLSASGECGDLAGNTASHAVSGVKIDRTQPEITFVSQTPEANEAGWNTTDVTLAWACSDSLSGPADVVATRTLTGDGAGQTADGTCADVAGNTAHDARTGINIDKTAPEIVFESRTEANEDGWNNTDVVVRWSCSDATSGAVAGSDTATVTTEGRGQSATGGCADVAGNTAEHTVGSINIDKTGAVTTIIGPPVAKAGGKIAGQVSDVMSGIDRTRVTFVKDGVSRTVRANYALGTPEGDSAAWTVWVPADLEAGTYTVTAISWDVAGNREASASAEIRVL